MSVGRAAVGVGILIFLALASGCKNSPSYGVSSGGTSWNASGADHIAGIDQGTARVTTLHCGPQQGVTVVVWSDLEESTRTETNADADRAFEEVALTGNGGKKVEYTVETTDGEIATVRLQGAEFSTTAGNLFLVSTQSNTPRIAQINTTLKEFPNEPEGIKDLAANHEEVEKFFMAAQAKSAPEAGTTVPQ
jgi:hypothetical protein